MSFLHIICHPAALLCFPTFSHVFLILKPFFKPSISDVKVSSDSGLVFSATFGHSSSGLGQSFLQGDWIPRPPCFVSPLLPLPVLSLPPCLLLCHIIPFPRFPPVRVIPLVPRILSPFIEIYFWNPERCKTWFCFTESC